ncbi:MAG: TIGR03619 family F420-dependent LLM class oxidoreductase [Acidimicrobiia bacterium]|nr:TIGR03619 family F420-dependent LLM class oxidoreductase [Acidimicrobiia bacterium]
MRFSYADAMIDPALYMPLARAVEDAGYDSFVVPDSIAYPRESDTQYPYTEDGGREFLEDKPMLEPFTLVAALGAVTERLRFTTFVLKLPVRLPVMVAKEATSAAVLTRGRLALGVGLSPWPEDYVVTDQAWRHRGRRMDEMIEIVRGLGTGDWFEYHGEFYDIPAVKMCPVPDDPVPILVGGHAAGALRRAARLGDGWMHAGGDPGELDACLETLSVLRADYGRDKDPFEIHVIHADGFSVDGCRRLEDRGVTDVIVGFRNPYTGEPDTQTLQDKIDLANAFAEHVVWKVKG